MHRNKVSFQELLDCFDNDLGNNLENNADNLEHNAEKLQEILNRIMQRIMSIITSALDLAQSFKTLGLRMSIPGALLESKEESEAQISFGEK